MAAPPIPLGLIGTGLAVEKPHRPAWRGLADRRVANSTIDAPSDLAPNLVHTGGVIGGYPTSHPGILVGQQISSSASFAA
jgi:hypothetical protein